MSLSHQNLKVMCFQLFMSMITAWIVRDKPPFRSSIRRKNIFSIVIIDYVCTVFIMRFKVQNIGFESDDKFIVRALRVSSRFDQICSVIVLPDINKRRDVDQRMSQICRNESSSRSFTRYRSRFAVVLNSEEI